MRIIFAIIFFLILIPFLKTISAEPSILITYSDTVEQTIFDGKWTDNLEWKQSSWDVIKSQGIDAVHIRSAHQGDFIYVMLDVVADQTLDNISDRAVICIDGKNDKANIADENDFCFQASLNAKQGFVYQGGSTLALNGHFTKIPNTLGFIGVGAKSDHNDKYSKTPHASYEFKIPLELLGRTDIYGFYILVYDASKSQFYSWPGSVTPSNTFEIPSPSKWGLLVSPDKSIPEFPLPALALIPAIFLAIYLTRKNGVRLENNNNVFTKAKKRLSR